MLSEKDRRSFELNIARMYAVRLLSWLHFFSAVLVPFFTDWGGISFSRVLFLNAWFMFCIFLFELPTGTAADFLGCKVSMALGAVTAVAGILIYVSRPSFAVFMAAETVLAISVTLFSGADETLAYETLRRLGREEQSRRVFSRMQTFKLTGILIGAVSGSVIASRWGLRIPFLVTAVPMTAALGVILTLRDPGTANTGTGRRYFDILRDGVRYFAGNRVLRILALDMVAVAAFAWLIIWFYQPLLESAGVSLGWFGTVHAMMSLSQIAVIQGFDRLERLLGSKRRLLLAGAVAPGVCYILLGLTHSVLLTVPAIVLAAGFGLSREPLFSTYLNRYIPSDKRATVLSAASMLRTLAIAVVNPLAGLLADWSLHYSILIVGVCLLAFTLVTGIREEHLTG